MAWVRRHSAESRMIELAIAIGGSFAGLVSGIAFGWSAGDSGAYAALGGLAGAIIFGLAGYLSIILFYWFIAPPQMAYEQKEKEIGRANLLASRFDKEYSKVTTERDMAVKKLGDHDQFETEYTMIERLKEKGVGQLKAIKDFPDGSDLFWKTDKGKQAIDNHIDMMVEWYTEVQARLSQYREDWGKYFYQESDGDPKTNARYSIFGIKWILESFLTRLAALQATIRNSEN